MIPTVANRSVASRWLIRSTALLLTIPIVIYMARNVWWSGISCWKEGWESRQFIYIGSTGIVMFVGLCVVTIAAQAVAWRITRDRMLVRWAIAPLAVLLGVYGLGFLASCFGVLEA
jgi:hypothetical protein